MKVRCCIAGGGPAGMMLGYLLARAGIDVAVLEKHGDFLRDFRGDTVHPSTMDVLYELGLLDAFLARHHSEIASFTLRLDGRDYPIADLSHLPTHCKFIALMPQWDFLDFLSEHARSFPNFSLLMNTEAVDLVTEGARVTGVRTRSKDGVEQTIDADLVVAADGRHSTLRAKSGLVVRDLTAPIDVLWFRLPRNATDPDAVLGNIVTGTIVVTIDRGDYWQCAFVIDKDSLPKLQAAGIDAFRERVARAVPFLNDRVANIETWDDAKLLTVSVDRLTTWYRDGLLCIGDAAHAMSPIGGVGINLAIQDAVATANILTACLQRGRPTTADLATVQKRRAFPTKAIQRVQVFAHDAILKPTIDGRPFKAPLALKLLQRFPRLRRIPARLLAVGPRPEHVR